MKDAAIGHQHHTDYKQILRKCTQQFLPFFPGNMPSDCHRLLSSSQFD